MKTFKALMEEIHPIKITADKEKMHVAKEWKEHLKAHREVADPTIVHKMGSPAHRKTVAYRYDAKLHHNDWANGREVHHITNKETGERTKVTSDFSKDVPHFHFHKD